jgi:hypothetical protein
VSGASAASRSSCQVTDAGFSRPRVARPTSRKPGIIRGVPASRSTAAAIRSAEAEPDPRASTAASNPSRRSATRTAISGSTASSSSKAASASSARGDHTAYAHSSSAASARTEPSAS